MKKAELLKEFLRVCRRMKRSPSADGFKKIEYLKFIGANVCPACEEEVDPDAYICVRGKDGQVVERYRCHHCYTDFIFPQESVH